MAEQNALLKNSTALYFYYALAADAKAYLQYLVRLSF